MSKTAVRLPDGRFVNQVGTTMSKFADNFAGGAYAAGTASKAALAADNKWRIVRDTGGMVVTLLNGSLTVGMGTANGAELLLIGAEDSTVPCNLSASIQVSQRLAANEIRVGYLEVDAEGNIVPNANMASFFRNHAAVLVTGTTITNLTLEAQGGGMTALRQITTTSQPNVAVATEINLEVRPEDVTMGNVVADSATSRAAAGARINTVVPSPNKIYRPFIWLRNVAAPASSTVFTLHRVVSMDVQELQAEVGGGRGIQGANAAIPVAPVAAGPIQPVSVNSVVATVAPNGAVNYKLISAASTNAVSLKTSVGRIVGGVAVNTGTLAYLKLYSKNAAPVVGTDIPQMTIPLPQNVPVYIGSIADQYGISLAAGVAIALTGGAADTDTTAVAANQIIVNVQYA